MVCLLQVLAGMLFFFFFFLSLALETIRKELEIIELDRNKVYDRTLHTM